MNAQLRLLLNAKPFGHAHVIHHPTPLPVYLSIQQARGTVI